MNSLDAATWQRQTFSDQYAVVVSSKDNPVALNLLLTSILVSGYPEALFNLRVVVRLEGTTLPDFYREQLSAAFMAHGAHVVFVQMPSVGVHQMREWQLKTSLLGSARYVLMLDDDVILTHNAIAQVALVQQELCSTGKEFAYIQGTKWDCSNVRGYKDFGLTPVHPDQATNYNIPVQVGYSSHRAPTRWLDTGFALFDRSVVKKHNLTFAPSNLDSFAFCGGEDALFALSCAHKGITNYWAKDAQAIHLEKPGGSRFTEAAYRKEAVLRAAQLCGYDTSYISEFMAWVPMAKNLNHSSNKIA